MKFILLLPTNTSQQGRQQSCPEKENDFFAPNDTLFVGKIPGPAHWGCPVAPGLRTADRQPVFLTVAVRAVSVSAEQARTLLHGAAHY